MISRVAIALVLAAGAPWAVGIGHAQAGSGWHEHRNEKFGFSLRYPEHVFRVERTAKAGDGQVFVSGDGGSRLLNGGPGQRERLYSGQLPEPCRQLILWQVQVDL